MEFGGALVSLALVAALAILAAALVLRAAAARTGRHLKREADRLHDEIWELREAAEARDPRRGSQRSEVALFSPP